MNPISVIKKMKVSILILFLFRPGLHALCIVQVFLSELEINSDFNFKLGLLKNRNFTD